jgi:hypothetical protein
VGAEKLIAFQKLRRDSGSKIDWRHREFTPLISLHDSLTRLNAFVGTGKFIVQSLILICDRAGP